jgi:hypothetical protein
MIEQEERLAEEMKKFYAEVEEYEEKVRLDAIKKQMEQIRDVATQMSDAFAAGVADMVAGTKSFGNALRGMVAAIIQAALKAIMASALKSGALSFESKAGIPLVGPILGAAAMAAAIAAVTGLMGRMPSAAGGLGRVPNDTLALIHKDETVLPASIAGPMRDAIAAGTFGGSRAAPVFNITTPDAESFYKMLKNRDSELFKVLREGQRDRRFG